MKNWRICTGLFFILITFIAFIGIYFKTADWLHLLLFGFTFYAVILIFNGIIKNRRKKFKINEFYRPFVSILIPARNEENVIADTIKSLSNLKYYRKGKKNYEIIVINDGSIDSTGKILNNLKNEIKELTVIDRPSNGSGKGKSSTLNDGLKYCHGEIIAVFDADTQIDPYFLKETVPYLYGDKIAGVQGRVRIYNAKDNFISGLQEDEFATFSHLLQLGREALGGMVALGGNGQLVKRKMLKKIGGWNQASTTEDIDLTLRLVLNGYRIRYCPTAQVWQEGVDSLISLVRQRIRWADGLIKCIFDYFLSLASIRVSFIRKLDGLISLGRVTIPLWIIVGYIYLIFSLLFKFKIQTSIPSTYFFYITLAFFLVMLFGMCETTKKDLFISTLRVLRFWSGSFIWLIVVPLAFINIFKSAEFYWDKTYHKGVKINSEVDLKADSKVSSSIGVS